jgi:GNAT superfamily N-acetyltransferase
MDGEGYRKALNRALTRIEQFNPTFLVVAFGLDPAKDDPTGTWSLRARDFERNGRLIGGLGLPTVVVQEGGYRTRTLGLNAMNFFNGLAKAAQEWANKKQVPKNKIHGLTLRQDIDQEDTERIRKLVAITGFFTPEEVEVAVELVTERLTKGESSGYHFVIAEHYGRLIGYTCYGPIACTRSSYDIYWIAVHPDYQGRGVGQQLLQETENMIKKAHGTRVYVDTSQRIQYASTRAFYERCSYLQESILQDFYGPGDGKVTYCKQLTRK